MKSFTREEANLFLAEQFAQDVDSCPFGSMDIEITDDNEEQVCDACPFQDTGCSGSPASKRLALTILEQHRPKTVKEI